ncbi:hypothetical protein T484DRAFT_1770261 [Baffinella frigidus]|nr:hypothetical protein T484DRAFT_1770261 [Cryptophyta sp. CCMP2293]
MARFPTLLLALAALACSAAAAPWSNACPQPGILGAGALSGRPLAAYGGVEAGARWGLGLLGLTVSGSPRKEWP